MDCQHKNLSPQQVKKLKKEIVYCKNENCSYHVEKMLPSVFIMGLNYIFSGLIVSLVCFLPLIYIDNFYFRVVAFLPLSAFGIWGFNVSGAGIYLCILCFFDQYIITDSNGKRYKYITIKNKP